MKKPKTFSLLSIHDRNLGDQWTDWKGDLKTDFLNANTGKRIYLSILLVSILFSGLLGFLLWYMMEPRLNEFHSTLPLIVGLIFGICWCILAVWFFLMVISILTGKDFFMRLGGREISVTFLVPLVLRLGTKFGLSRDRIGNSFVKVSNTLIQITARKISPEKLLILLPRCLQKPIIQHIVDFAKSLNIPVFTVSGGTKARQVVHQVKPQAIIGVACERDLISGIQEILPRIPVIGIPNRRPEGPCKNTIIDLKEFEFAIQIFLGRNINGVSLKK
jgi:hypothetical protein